MASKMRAMSMARAKSRGLRVDGEQRAASALWGTGFTVVLSLVAVMKGRGGTLSGPDYTKVETAWIVFAARLFFAVIRRGTGVRIAMRKPG
jgi:hypothetical protein